MSRGGVRPWQRVAPVLARHPRGMQMMPSAISGAMCLWTALVGTGACAGSSSSRMDIAIVSGDAQTAAPGQTVPQPLVVAVTDAQGMAAVGAQVSWGVISGGGSLSAQTTTTDAMGRAQTTYTLGFSLGSNRIAARPVGTSTRGTFAATASLLGGGGPNEPGGVAGFTGWGGDAGDRESTRLKSRHNQKSYYLFC